MPSALVPDIRPSSSCLRDAPGLTQGALALSPASSDMASVLLVTSVASCACCSPIAALNAGSSLSGSALALGSDL